MLEGVNEPPTVPEEVSPPVGVTDIVTADGLTVRLTPRVAFPWPFVVFVNVTVSEYVPAASELAVLLIVTVTVVVAPAASVPLTIDNATQFCPFVTVQLMDVPPVFCNV